MISVDQYLHMSFDGPASEYLDGDLLERHWGEKPHSRAQTRLIRLLTPTENELVFAELHLRTASRRFRVADIAVIADEPAKNIPDVPPLITIEIDSIDDRHEEIRQNCEEYRVWGVRHIWWVDPYARRFSVYDAGGWHDVPHLVCPERDIATAPEPVFD